jgi:hypothetical protein
MQNNVIVFYLALILRLLRDGLKLVGGMFVYRRDRAGRLGLGAFSLSVDLDSARLDAVSRSLLWGSGIPIPEPARTADCPPRFVSRPWRRRGTGPEIFLHHDV